MPDESDHWGELWGAVREQERICQSIKLIEGLRALDGEGREQALFCLKNLQHLAELNGRVTVLRLMRYQESLKPSGS